MSDKFSKIPIATANRSKHDLSSPHITTTDFGRLDVVYHTQLLEGDDLNMHLHSFLRAAPMPQPTIGKVYMNVRAFFIPNRILFADRNYWNNWRCGLTSGAHPYVQEKDLVNKAFQIGTGSSALAPTLGVAYRKDFRRLLSQLGFPERVFNYGATGGSFTAYNKKYNPFALYSYNRIWWDWYRDSNLIDDSQISNYVQYLGAGYNDGDLLRPRYCCYQKDIFTTAFKNPQSGGAAKIPAASAQTFQNQLPPNPENILLSDGSISSLYAGIANNIQFLRAANSLQKYLERNNIAGGRVMARFLARFGVTPDSVRLDQSEYVGGFSMPLNIGDVTANLDTGEGSQASEPDNAFTSPVNSYAGQLAGKAMLAGNDNLQYHAKEDGTFMVISTLVPEIFYYQGVPADLLRGVDNVKEDYFTPEYENLGFEPLKRIQVAATRLNADPNGTYDQEIFGFVPRYSSYKYKLGVVSGDNVLTETMTGLQGYHLGRNLLTNGINQASLLPEFTMITPADRLALDRIFYVPGQHAGDLDHFEGIHVCDCKIVRPMSAAKLPSLEEDAHTSGKVVTIDNGGMRM